ncbi:MAG: thioredoxin family protein [Planctomycetes bacterium]|nr:thioredoxin family protein [Planctomycetota bacterium]
MIVLVAAVAIYRQRPHPAAPSPNGTPTSRLSALPRILDLGADKCAACKDLAPILAELKREYEGKALVDFIDVWKDPSAAEPYGVRIIPTQIFFDRTGKEVWRHEGFLSKAEFVAKLKELGAG